MPKGEHLKAKREKYNFTSEVNPMKDKALLEKKVKSQIENTKKKRLIKDLLNSVPTDNDVLFELAAAARLYGIEPNEVTLGLLLDFNMIRKAKSAIDKDAVSAYMAINKKAGEIIDKQMPVDQNGDLIKRGKDGVTYIVTIGDNI